MLLRGLLRAYLFYDAHVAVRELVYKYEQVVVEETRE